MPAEPEDVLEADEMWSFVHERWNKRWIWTVICRWTRQIVAFIIGNRSEVACRKLWEQIPLTYRVCQSYSDFWEAYQLVFPEETHACVGKGSGQTNRPDGKRLAFATQNGVYVYNATIGEQLLHYIGQGEGVRSSGITFSPEGKWIASSGNDGNIRVWDAHTGKDWLNLTGHTGPTFGVAFSPDGQYLASSSTDHTVKIWALPKQGEQVAEPLTLYGNSGAVYQIAFSPDGMRLTFAGRDHVVHIYALNIEDLINIAKSRLTRTWTLEECQKYLHLETCPAEP